RVPVAERADGRGLGLQGRRRRGAVSGPPRPAREPAGRGNARVRPAPLAVAGRLARPVPVAAGLAAPPRATRRGLVPRADARAGPGARPRALRRGAALPPRPPACRPRDPGREGAPLRAAAARDPDRRAAPPRRVLPA